MVFRNTFMLRKALLSLGWVFIIFPLLSSKALGDSDVNSGNYFLPGCQAFIATNFNSSTPFRAGECLGVIRAITYNLTSNSLICIPSTVTMGQIVRVIVRNLENNPAHLHEDFFLQVAYALGSIWPCPVRK